MRGPRRGVKREQMRHVEARKRVHGGRSQKRRGHSFLPVFFLFYATLK